MPFLTETMYRTSRGPEAAKAAASTSAHYPNADETLIDDAALRRHGRPVAAGVAGLAARNAVKIKVRQPLAEMKVQPG